MGCGLLALPDPNSDAACHSDYLDYIDKTLMNGPPLVRAPSSASMPWLRNYRSVDINIFENPRNEFNPLLFMCCLHQCTGVLPKAEWRRRV